MISINIEPNLADAQEGQRLVACLQALYGLDQFVLGTPTAEQTEVMRTYARRQEEGTGFSGVVTAFDTAKGEMTVEVPAPTVPTPPVPPVPQVPAAPQAPAAPPAPPPAAAAPQPTAPAAAPVSSQTAVPTPPVPSAPATAVPTAPAATASPAAGGSLDELDVRGLPWDARIHASTRAKNADGTWRQMRGVETKTPGIVAAVEAQLRVNYPDPQVAAAQAPAVPQPPAVPTPPTPDLAQAFAAPRVPVVPPVPPVPQVPAVPQPPVPPAAPADGVVKPTTFMGMLEKIRNLVEVSCMMSVEEVELACQAVGVPALLNLGAIAAIDATVISRLDAEIERVLAS